MWPFKRRPKPPEEENIVDRFSRLIDERRFREALPVIREILARSPAMPTSWFNLGICLAELKRHQEAADAFLEAYKLEPSDGGALYRGCLALAAAGNADQLYRVAKRICEIEPEMIYNFVEEDAFKPFFQRPEFVKLRDRYDLRGDA